MQFFHMRDDESKNWHNYLIIQVTKEEYSAIHTRFGSQTPKLNYGTIIRDGYPYVIFEYGAMINLGEAFGSGQTLGEKLQVGDIVTVILTDKPQDQLFILENNSLKLNFALSEVIVYPFTYTKEMEQIYEFYAHYAILKEGTREVSIKNKSRLSLR
jgi:hypothetical protein